MAYRVLIADDDEALLTSLSVRLRSEGYEVACARDSNQAMEWAGVGWPDVLILDINMPGGDGWRVPQQLRRIDSIRGVPLIYLTGERSERVVGMADYHGACALIHKPFETKDLLAAVERAVRSLRPRQLT